MTAAPWLVRTSKNQILGPFAPEALRDKILAGEFSAQDEICPANGYWIFLHEQAELQNALGVTLPRGVGFGEVDDEITETQTDTLVDEVSPRSAATSISAQSSAPSAPLRLYQPQVLGRIEKPSLWRGVVVLLAIALAALLVLVFQILGRG